MPETDPARPPVRNRLLERASTGSGPTVLVVAGGSAPTAGDQARWSGVDVVVAADSGVDHALRAGLAIDYVVGDLDSVSPQGLALATGAGARIEVHPPDKDQTDLELALDRAVSLAPSRVIITGTAGGRLDHFLANMLLIASPRYRETTIDVVTDADRIHVVHDARHLRAEPGQLITLLPIHGPAVGVTTEGLRYPLRDETLPVASPRGVSNQFLTPAASVSLRHGTLLVILPASGGPP